MPEDIVDEQVTFQGHGRLIEAFVARPGPAGPERRTLEIGGRQVEALLAQRAVPLPAVVVVHEIWGLADHIRDVARRFAAEGYLALAPDLYTGELRDAMTPANIMAGMQILRQAPPDVQRDPRRLQEHLGEFTPEQRRALTTLMDVMSPQRRAAFSRDLVGAVSYLASRRDVDGTRIGSVGFCMGGGLSGQLATLSPTLQACVIFYGENPPLDAVGSIHASVLGLYGGEDHRITDTVPTFAASMTAAGKTFDYHVYPDAQHAFFNDTRSATYNPEAAHDAWRRVLDFFGRELRGGR